MGSAVPVVGAVVAGFVTSKVVSEVGKSIGLDDGLTNILGAAAGVAVGGLTYGQASGTAASTAATTAAVAATPPPNIPGTPIAPSAGMPTSNIPGTPLAPHTSPYASKQSAGSGGMLSQGSMPAPSAAPSPQQPVPTAGRDTSGTMIKEATTTKPAQVAQTGTEKSWVEKLFSPEKTIDLIMAGMAGYGEAGMRKEEMEYPEKIAEKNARGWANAYPGQLSINQQYPSQGGG